jgi:hypothetical protein
MYHFSWYFQNSLNQGELRVIKRMFFEGDYMGMFFALSIGCDKYEIIVKF